MFGFKAPDRIEEMIQEFLTAELLQTYTTSEVFYVQLLVSITIMSVVCCIL